LRSVAPITATNAGVKKLSRAVRTPLEEPATMDDAIAIPTLVEIFLAADIGSDYSN
jgi:hypothetical protein